jgi:hypothetical protein
MSMRVQSGRLLMLAAMFMFVAILFQIVTIAGNDYRMVLLVAFVCMAVAVACCLAVFVRGGVLRWLAVVIALPSLFIIPDLMRRVLNVWGGA